MFVTRLLSFASRGYKRSFHFIGPAKRQTARFGRAWTRSADTQTQISDIDLGFSSQRPSVTSTRQTRANAGNKSTDLFDSRRKDTIPRKRSQMDVIGNIYIYISPDLETLASGNGPGIVSEKLDSMPQNITFVYIL